MKTTMYLQKLELTDLNGVAIYKATYSNGFNTTDVYHEIENRDEEKDLIIPKIIIE
jgi:hypothetical protein|tara:strand:+ start:20 stop:187 length:168 start_codon:yes stop_codon:yes gene_type:complete